MSDFDLVLKRGTLVDGTGGEPLRGDLGLRGGRIAAIGAELAGAQTLDCEGLCVAPGFIDTFARDDLAALAPEPALESRVRQGVTLELIGQDGVGPAPLRQGDVAARRERLRPVLGSPETDWSWRSVASYLDALDAARPLLDLAYLVPHGAVRESIVGPADGPAAPHDVFRMKGLLARSLDEGAWGVSFGLDHPPGCFADREELVELAAVAASRDVPIVARLRSGAPSVVEGLEELAAVGREAGARVHVPHLEVRGPAGGSRLPELVAALEEARRRGVELTADVHPYPAGLRLLSTLLPAWAWEGGVEALLARLAEAGPRARIRAHLEAPHGAWGACGAQNILYWGLPPERRDLVGRDAASAAEGSGRDPLDFALDLLREARLEVAVLLRDQSEEAFERLLALPGINVSAGGLALGRPHPRLFGAFPRVLARSVRERGALGLAAAVRKMTGLPADTFGLGEVGYLVEGKRANLVVFDPAAILDPASFEEPEQFPLGVREVFVGGRAVVRDGRLTGERAGRVARRGRR